MVKWMLFWALVLNMIAATFAVAAKDFSAATAFYACAILVLLLKQDLYGKED